MKIFASISLEFSTICSLVSNVFIKINDYSNTFVFIPAHKVRVLCSSITLISSLNFPHFLFLSNVFIEIHEYSN